MRADPGVTSAPRVSAPRPAHRQARLLPRPASIPGFLTAGVLLAAFLLFFILPVLWLLLAATKTDSELVYRSPFSFGSWHALRENWDALTRFQGDTILLWLRNSALQSFGALVITLLAGIPAGDALAMMEFRGRRVLLIATLVVMLMPATTLVIPLFLEQVGLGLLITDVPQFNPTAGTAAVLWPELALATLLAISPSSRVLVRAALPRHRPAVRVDEGMR